MPSITTNMKMIRKNYFVETKSQTMTSGRVLSKVHGIDKGVDPNLRPEKQVIKPLSVPIQSKFPIELKGQFHVKSRVGQGRAGIKRKMIQIFPMSQAHNKPERPKLLPGRRSILKIAQTNFTTT